MIELIILIIVINKLVNGSPIKRRRYNRGLQKMSDDQNREFMEWSMNESMRIITPFEHGGYDMTQGNSFNHF